MDDVEFDVILIISNKFSFLLFLLRRLFFLNNLFCRNLFSFLFLFFNFYLPFILKFLNWFRFFFFFLFNFLCWWDNFCWCFVFLFLFDWSWCFVYNFLIWNKSIDCFTKKSFCTFCYFLLFLYRCRCWDFFFTFILLFIFIFIFFLILNLLKCRRPRLDHFDILFKLILNTSHMMLNFVLIFKICFLLGFYFITIRLFIF